MSFSSGDMVTVKLWDDMVEEYGTQYNGNSIRTYYSFPWEMKSFCGKEAKIVSVDGYGVVLDFFDGELNRLAGRWNFDINMIKHVEEEEYDVPDESDLMGFIGI